MNDNAKTPGRYIRAVTTVTVVMLAIGAAVLSYYSLSHLAMESGIPAHLSWLFPVIIDGLVLAGSMLVLYSAIYKTSSWFGWLLTLLGVGASTVGNIFIAPPTFAAQAVHAAPPIILALSLEGLMMLLRHSTTLRVQAQARAAVAHVLPVEETSTQARPVTRREVASSTTSVPQVAASPTVAPRILDDVPPAPQVVEEPVASAPALVTDEAISTPEVVAPRPSVALDAPARTIDPDEESPMFAALRHASAASAPAPRETVQQSLPVASGVTTNEGGMTIREQVLALIDGDPNITVDAIANAIEGDRKYIRKIARTELDKRLKAA